MEKWIEGGKKVLHKINRRLEVTGRYGRKFKQLPYDLKETIR
jgi:hypothetical protein